MKTGTQLILPSLLLLASVPSGYADAVLWKIGEADKSGKEFALDRNHELFRREIPADFVYQVGQDEPGKWPYIHPGPIDGWAGETTHPLKVRFTLGEVPKGECVLVVNIVAPQAGAPKLQAAINGEATAVRLPHGPGDGVLSDESKGAPSITAIPFHPEMLRAGPNEITLTVVEGGWLLYDSVQLEERDAQAKRLAKLELVPTPLFTGTDSDLKQVVRMVTDNRGPNIEARYTVSVNRENGPAAEIGRESQQISFGEQRIDLEIPPVDRPTTVTVDVELAGEKSTAVALVAPQRKWIIFAQPSIHTDIGYTDRQIDVFRRHNVNLDKVKELCRRNPLFRWNIEVAWEVQNYFSDRSERERQELIELMQQGRVGLNAGYLNLLTALMSDEAMNRFAYYSAGLRRQYHIPTPISLMTDIPTATRGMAAMLAASGVRYFAEGCNQDRGPIINHSGIRSPFYWEGVDGSRVLMLLSAHYAQSAWLAHAGGVEGMYDAVQRIVSEYERFGDEYPYDAIYQYGAFLDNWEVDMRYGEWLDDWNRKYTYPKIQIIAGPEFFEYMEKNYADKLPVRKTDFGAYWEDGAGSTQQETTLHMRNQHRTPTAEALWALSRIRGADGDYPLARFNKVWEDILFYAEHTWGAAQSISAPDDPMTIDQWKVKSEYAHRPHAESTALLEEGLKAYVSTVPANAGDLVVFNPSSWPRSGVVRPGTEGTGTSSSAAAIWVEDIPPMSSKIVPVAKDLNDQVPQETAADGILENRFYRIDASVDRGITSIRDKETDQELVNLNAGHSLGQIVYASGGEGTRMIHPDRGPYAEFEQNSVPERALEAPQGKVLVTNGSYTSLAESSAPGLYQELVLAGTAPAMPDVKTRVRLHEREKRISLDVEITSKTEIRKKEAVYIAFPFVGEEPEFRLGLTNSIQRPDKDFAKGACHEWYCVQDFVTCADPKSGTEVVWTSPDVPLVCLSQLNRGRWIVEPELTTPTIFSYAMNNYWHTNYKAGQGGDFHFRYDLTSGKSGIANEQCLRFARETATPLLSLESAGVAKSNGAERNVTVTGKGVVASVAGAQDGKSTIVRLRNCEDTPALATLATAGKRAALVTLVEDPVANSDSDVLKATQEGCTVRLKPQQVVTLRID